jgi:hypothetical protein
VTYNYDRVIEYYFQSVLKGMFQLDQDAAASIADRIPVVHLHGLIPQGRPFGSFPSTPSADVFRDIAAGIKIIHSGPSPSDPEFEEARILLAGAEVICFLGFGYHPLNIERLGLTHLLRTHVRRPEVICGFFGMREAEISTALSRLGLGSIAIAPKQGSEPAELFLRSHVELY